ncbi:hypothetical protein F2Q68_00014175 [Brassica cretica]|uniref:Uncharacterized protein n=1 Tax=Brassica cretica TaxID=69181 RepID=A0A8S9HM28_BRACR|nr:hypothetical protein F2Q68_00014175 [Brassica cretica]
MNVTGEEVSWFLLRFDEDYDHLFDDFSVVDNVNNISLPSELPDCDFTDVELEHGDMKFAFADQLAHPPLNIACP